MIFPYVAQRNPLIESNLDDFDDKVMTSVPYTVSGMKSIDRYVTCGGTSRIYEGTWTEAGKDVACIFKVFVKNSPHFSDFFMGDTWTGETTSQQILGNRDDAIARLLHAGNTDDFFYSVSEKVNGHELDELALVNELSVRTFCDYMHQTASIVSTIHDFGYVHGDLNFRNIMVEGDGRVRLIDFGQSRPIGSPIFCSDQKEYVDSEYVYSKQLDKSRFGILIDHYADVQINGFYAGGRLIEDLRDLSEVCLDETSTMDFKDLTRILGSMK